MKRKILLIVAVVSGTLALLAAIPFWRRGPAPLTAFGTLEAHDISVGSKVTGRVTQVLAQEGDHVKAGQPLVIFDDAELAASLLQARGRYEQAQANLDKAVHGSRREDIEEADAAIGDDDAPGYRTQAVDQARADLAQAEANARQAERDYQRYAQLAADGIVSRQLLDAQQAQRDASVALVASRRHALEAAQGQLRAASAVADRVRRGSRVEDIAAARADAVAAEGALREAEALWRERQVLSPAGATVETLDIRPGDLLPANSPVAKLLEADQLYVMVYVPEDQIGHVMVGQKAELTIDAFPKAPFPAVVEQIRQQAEYLPRNTQTREEREHEVVGVKLRVDNRDNRLRPGIAATVRFTGGE